MPARGWKVRGFRMSQYIEKLESYLKECNAKLHELFIDEREREEWHYKAHSTVKKLNTAYAYGL
jgi:hypothetical protein